MTMIGQHPDVLVVGFFSPASGGMIMGANECFEVFLSQRFRPGMTYHDRLSVNLR